MSTALAIDRRAVVAGALAAAVVVVPAAVFNDAVAPDEGDDASAAVFLAFLLILGGLALGGFVAGRRQPNTPLVHGAAAAALTYLVLQGVFLLRRAIVGDAIDTSVLGVVFLALLAASAGMAGGLVASWRHSRRIDATNGGGS